MKTYILTLVLASISLFSIGQNNLNIEITNLKTNSGTLKVQLFTANNKLFKQTEKQVTGQICTVSFKDVPNGTYAVQYFHDENDNGKMDTGMFGKPEEGYGYSNDARGMFGPADFEDQLFEINKHTSITLKTVQ